jgi:hypothetical protein
MNGGDRQYLYVAHWSEFPSAHTVGRSQGGGGGKAPKNRFTFSFSLPRPLCQVLSQAHARCPPSAPFYCLSLLRWCSPLALDVLRTLPRAFSGITRIWPLGNSRRRQTDASRPVASLASLLSCTLSYGRFSVIFMLVGCPLVHCAV